MEMCGYRKETNSKFTIFATTHIPNNAPTLQSVQRQKSQVPQLLCR